MTNINKAHREAYAEYVAVNLFMGEAEKAAKPLVGLGDRIMNVILADFRSKTEHLNDHWFQKVDKVDIANSGIEQLPDEFQKKHNRLHRIKQFFPVNGSGYRRQLKLATSCAVPSIIYNYGEMFDRTLDKLSLKPFVAEMMDECQAKCVLRMVEEGRRASVDFIKVLRKADDLYTQLYLDLSRIKSLARLQTLLPEAYDDFVKVNNLNKNGKQIAVVQDYSETRAILAKLNKAA